jgi:hypothetical protein
VEEELYCGQKIGKYLFKTSLGDTSVQSSNPLWLKVIGQDFMGIRNPPRDKLIIPNLVLAIERTVVRIAFAQVRVHIHKEP